MNKNISIFFFVSLLLYLQSFGQDNILTVEKAVELTLTNNLDIKISKGVTKIAENNSSKLNAGFLPTLAGNASATYQNQTTRTTFDNNNPDRNIEDAESQLYSAGLNLNYTLFDGLGRAFNYKTLKERHQLSEIETKQVIDLSILDLLSIYFQAAQLSENIDFAKNSLEVSKKRLKRANYQFEYGQNTKLGSLNAQVDIANDSINLVQLEQQRSSTLRDLKLLLNEKTVSFNKLDTNVIFIPKKDLENIVSKYKRDNLSILLTNKQVEINDLQLKALRATFFPRLNLTGSYGWGRNNNPPTAFFGGNTATRNTWRAGLGLSWTIFDSGRRLTNLKNAKIAIENSNLTQQNRINNINRQIDNAWISYNSAEKVLKLLRNNSIATQNNFERSEASFKLGQLSSIEYRQAQLNTLQAKFNISSAKYQLKLAELRLLQLSGNLLKELR